jgi:predicted ATPase
MRELPSGTVTLLFTDIEGSTRLLHELGDGYADVLAEHRRVLREAFGAHAGVEVDTQGDAFFVAFAKATDALAAADDAQRALAEGPVRVRMGVHTGEPLVTEEGYVGADVHRAARIMAAGHGGQVVVSEATARLLDGGSELRDLGEHRLKDLTAPQRLFQLGDGEFPPLKTLYQTNLPTPATPFLGRADELAAVTALLRNDGNRLVTLTGAGGSGKTRLALQVAGAVADDYPHGVWWVPLAPIADPAAVIDAAGRALGAGGRVAEAIADRRLLLLLDNFEHVIAAAADVARLAAECPNLDVLVTSRERLQVAGEHVYPVPVLARAEARTLFVERAVALRPDFRPDDAVDRLCESLDDLPLALELAAARTVLLTPEQLLERLGRRLDLLKGGRDAERRQQTLRATIEWSHELLEPAEQELFARLAVFAGGCTLEAAEAICDADLDTMQSLVDKSLLRVRDDGRFWMLETIREFARERLDESQDAADLRRAHAEWFRDVAVAANLAEDSDGLVQHHEVALQDAANLIAAIDWGEAHDAELGLTVAVALENYWATQDPWEGQRRLRRLLEKPNVSPRLRARGWRAIGSAVTLVGGLDEAGEVFERSLREFQALGDVEEETRLLHRLATHALWLEDYDEARRLADRVEELLARNPHPRLEAQLPGTRAWIERAGDKERALELYRESAERSREIGFVWWEGSMLTNAASLALELGHVEQAHALLQDALPVTHSIHDRRLRAFCLGLLAAVAARRGDADRAGTLWGALLAEDRRAAVPGLNEARERLRQRIGDVPADAVLRGEALTLDETVAYALSVD